MRKELAASKEQDETDEPIEYEKETILYKRSDYLGQKKTIHLAYDVDMNIEATAIYDDGREELLTTIDINDISTIMEGKVFKEGNITKPKVSLSFELSRSNIFQLLSAKISVDETVLEEVIPEEPEKKEEDKEDDAEEGDQEKSSEDAEAT